MKKMYWLAPLGALLVIQLIRPEMSNPPVDPALDVKQVLQPSAEVQTILKAACYDCHSNETRYPWYSQVAPVSWWLSSHIQEGREKLNFSTIGTLSAKDLAEALDDATEAVQEGEMPLYSYTWTHPAARLSDAQRTALVDWLKASDGGGEIPESAEAGDGSGGEGEADDD